MSGKQREKMIEILSHEEFQFHGILFSAGGNDIVGLDLQPLLRNKEPNMSWRDCIIDETWERKLLQIKLDYEDLILVRDLHSPNIPIFVNGYDYALPDGRPVRLLGFPVVGPWLDNVFRKRNIKAGKDQREIVKVLIDGFKELQENLESNTANYHFVNTPGTLEPNDDHWGDELHPSKVGFIHIAQKFKNELEDVFPEIN